MSPGSGPSPASSPDEQPPPGDEATTATPEAVIPAVPDEALARDDGPAAPGEASAPGSAAAKDAPADATANDPKTQRTKPADSGATGTFASLRVRNYRLFFSGAVVSNTGTWMQRIAQDWLVHSLTGSAAAVGTTIALQFLPMLLFGLYGGVLADRLDKRRLLLATQASMGLTGLILAALTLSGQVTVAHVYVLAFVLGVVTVIDSPARQTFVNDMVGPRLLRNAVSLNSANFQTARIVGPTVAGVMIAAVGSGYAFLFNGLSFIAPVTVLLLMRTSELNSVERAPRGKGQLRAGLRYVGKRPQLLWPIVLIGFIGTFGFNFPIWIVAFTDGIFDAGAGTYGALNALMAVGSLTGALIAARWGTSRVRYLVVSGGIFGAFLMALGGAPNLWVFAVLIVPTGLVGMTLMITGNTSVQLNSDPAMRGRVMSLYTMVFLGGTPFGGPLMGWLTDHYGPRIALLAGGAICGGAALAVGVVLARIGGLRLEFALRPGKPLLAFVPRASKQPTPATAEVHATAQAGQPLRERPGGPGDDARGAARPQSGDGRMYARSGRSTGPRR